MYYRLPADNSFYFVSTVNSKRMLAYLLLFSIGIMPCIRGDVREQLTQYLFDENKFQNSVRPVCHNLQTSAVALGIDVHQILYLDEPSQTLYLKVWMRKEWFDCQLTWDPNKFGGIKRLIVPRESIWMPDVMFFDHVGDSPPQTDLSLLSVHHDGKVHFKYPFLITTVCKMDVTFFPVDSQVCPLHFGSWSHSIDQINITTMKRAVITSNWLPNNEFDLTSVTAERHLKNQIWEKNPYTHIVFLVAFRRKPLFYIINILCPYLVVTVLAMMGFLLPPSAGEKISLETTVLLSIDVFLHVVAERLPATSETYPLIGIFFNASITLVSLSIAMAVYVLFLHHTDHKPVPHWLRILTYKITRISCFKDILKVTTKMDTLRLFRKRAGKQNRQMTNQHRTTMVHSVHQILLEQMESDVDGGHAPSGRAVIRFEDPAAPSTEHDTGRPDDVDGFSGGPKINIQHLQSIAEEPVTPGYEELSPLLDILHEQLDLMRMVEADKEISMTVTTLQREWEEIAMIFDRLFLVLYLFMYLVTCAVCVLPLAFVNL